MNLIRIRQSLLTLTTMLVLSLNLSALENVRFVLDQDGKAFALYLNSQVKQAIDIRIQDNSGFILWEENFQAKGKVAKKFSFDQLPLYHFRLGGFFRHALLRYKPGVFDKQ